jgi:N-acetylglucosamine kinase-like BadF-type ATPase
VKKILPNVVRRKLAFGAASIIEDKFGKTKTLFAGDGLHLLCMALYLGVDAGGTKTECAVSNGAELLGQAVGPTCKLAYVGKEKGRENLQRVMEHAAEAARVLVRDVQHVCIGMSGASLPESVSWAQETVREIIPQATIYVAGDHLIAHRAAFGTSHGVLVISGTGSIAFGRNQAGETARAGGWGPSISDEGSAFWVGREAVAAALRSYDHGVKNGLLAVIAEMWNVAPEELAGAVSSEAEKGDPTAREITERAGVALAGLASAVIERLWPSGGVVPVALAGGVLQNSTIVRQAFRNAVKEKHPEAAVSFAFVRPVMGALEIAAHRGRR